MIFSFWFYPFVRCFWSLCFPVFFLPSLVFFASLSPLVNRYFLSFPLCKSVTFWSNLTSSCVYLMFLSPFVLVLSETRQPEGRGCDGELRECGQRGWGDRPQYLCRAPAGTVPTKPGSGWMFLRFTVWRFCFFRVFFFSFLELLWSIWMFCFEVSRVRPCV